MNETKELKCCPPMITAQKSGTDNEGWGPLIERFGGAWDIGCGLPDLQYCPWCGKDVQYE